MNKILIHKEMNFHIIPPFFFCNIFHHLHVLLQNRKKIFSKINFIPVKHSQMSTNTEHSEVNKHKNRITYQSNHYSLNDTSPSQKHLEITIHIAKSRMTSFEYTL